MKNQNSTDIYQRIAERMQQARSQANNGKGFTQQELATLLGVTPVTLSRWETGVRQPSFDLLGLFAKLVNKPLSFFFEEQPQDDNFAQALLRITDELGDEEKQDILDYAHFRYEQWYKKLTSEE